MNPLAYYPYTAHPLILILVVLLLIGALPVYPYNRGWGYPPLLVVVILVLVVFFFGGCANMTPEQAKLLADVETTALTAGVIAGSTYAQNGDVNTAQLIATGLQSTSGILADVISIQQSHVTTAKVVTAVQTQTNAPKVVKNVVAPKVANAATAAIAAGVPPKAVSAAATKGLQDAATSVVATAKSNQ